MAEIARDQRASPTRASFAQERMWFLEQLDPGMAVYNLPEAFIITGLLRMAAFESAITELFRRHESLRTNLYMADGRLFQHISSPGTMELQAIDLSGLPYEMAIVEAERLSIEEVKKPFDLKNEPLARIFLFKLAAEEHLLLFVAHHAIFDGWSAGVLMEELTGLYQAASENSTPPPEQALQYIDYASWQRERYERGDLDGQLRYWQDRLNGELPMLELPADRHRPAVQSFDGASYIKDIPGPLADGIKALARREKATLFTILLAAYNAFLYRHTGQDDIVVGCPVAGRNYRELEGIIGLFVNTLPMRNRISPEMTFTEVAREARRSAFEAYENQDIPFDKMVEKLSIARQPSRTPVFQTFFQVVNIPTRQISQNGITFKQHNINYVTAKVDLTLHVTETPAGLSCRFVYPTALFDKTTIVAMAEHWEIFLRGIVDNPDQPVASIPLLTPAETLRIVHEWNETGTAYPRDTAVHRIFEERAKATPDEIAIIHGEEQVTYGQLNSRASRLARHLKIPPGTATALYMERSTDMVVCELAVLKAGGVYVPIDPSDPPDRTQFMLKDTHAAVLLVKSKPEFDVPGPCRVICLDDEREAIDCLDDGDLPDIVAAGNLAYIMYTSGTTGRPKGVRVPHRAINRLVINTNYIHLGAGDMVAHISNPAFDASTFEVWGALLNGAQLVIYGQDTVLSPAEFSARIREDGITTMFLTTQLFNLLVREAPGVFENVRDLLTGGEIADASSFCRVLSHGPPQRLIHVYGPTENTTFSTWYQVRDVPLDGEIPIGKPVSNTTVYMLDERMKSVPVGVTGEIYLGGDGVTHGYHERPDLDASAFIPDPFCIGSKLYRTGDLGCYLPDGNIKFLGRRDAQVKIRGFRVETGEVKSVLEAHPSVKASLVAMKELKGERGLVAYIVPEDSGSIDESILREYMRAKLPEYMIPVTFISIEAIPLTPTGKVDYRALPMPGDRPPGNGERPRDELERDLAGIWEEVLGIEKIRIDDDFFDLGGHSLKAVSLCAKIGETLRVKLPVNTVFLAPTISRMATAIRGSRGPNSLLLIKNGPVRPPLFCVIAIGGTLAEYAPMVGEFENDRQVYALQMPWHDQELVPGSIEELAMRLIEDVKAVQPHGPYNLLGYCAGGAVAYEMAARLRSAGEEIGFLGLIDLVPPDYQYHLDRRSLRILVGRFPIVLSNIARAPRGQRPAKISGIPAVAGQFLGNLARREPGFGPRIVRPYPEWLMAMPGPYYEPSLAAYEIYKKYAFRLYEGEVTLFFSRKTMDNFKDALYVGPALGWEKYVDGSLKIHIIPGDHETMTRPPSAKELARAVEKYLATYKSPGGGTA